MGRRPKVRFMVFFGEEDPELLNDPDTWRPMTIGCYPSAQRAIDAIKQDVESPWHADQDFTMLYRGIPGGQLEFLGKFRRLADLVAYLGQEVNDEEDQAAAS